MPSHPLVEELRKRIMEKGSSAERLFLTDPMTHAIYASLDIIDQNEDKSTFTSIEQYVVTVLLQLLEERKKISDDIIDIMTKPSPSTMFARTTSQAIKSIEALRAKAGKINNEG